MKASNGSVTVTATDNTIITSTGGGVAIAAGLSSGVGIAAAAGLAIVQNTMNNQVLAYVDAATVTATKGDVHVEADENVTINSISAEAPPRSPLGQGPPLPAQALGPIPPTLSRTRSKPT